MTDTFDSNLEKFQPLYELVRRVDFFIGQALQRDEAKTYPNFSATETLEEYQNPFLLNLAAALQLTEFELDVIALAIAPELDSSYGEVYAHLQKDSLSEHPTIDLALKLLCDTAGDRLEKRSAFASGSPLIVQQIIQLLPPLNRVKPSLISHFVVLDQQLIRLLLQQPGLDNRLQNSCVLEQPIPATSTSPLQQKLCKFAAAHQQENQPLRLYLKGKYSAIQLDTAAAIASSLQQSFLGVNLKSFLTATEQNLSLIPILLREAWFQNAILFVEQADLLWQSDHQCFYEKFVAAIARHQGTVIFAGTKPWQPSPTENLDIITIPLDPPNNDQRLTTWQTSLAQNAIKLDNFQLQQLSQRYVLTPAQINNAVAIAQKTFQWQQLSVSNPDIFQELCSAARLQSGHSLITLAKKIEPQYSWDDVVLPSEILAQLQGICKEAEYRYVVHEQWGFADKLSLGKGLNVLFAGSPGTGKTMTAEAIANHLQLDLYKIDLSQIISKYIGETEKNLSKIFTAAADSNAILLFDEADALFGKRSEVQDAHDRYANIEVGFLLQQMEEYEGITILTTNLRSNMDPAFERRLRFIVEFPKPDVGDRQRIWQQIFPQDAPVAQNIDWDFLAKQFELTGANIKNVALTAAFYAADNKTEITMSAIIFALKREYQKMGQILRDKDLGKYIDVTPE
ncbi:AAA ATPase central domain protein [[Leptolyngbya] sp. PCC 7376]|uniref:ATP-binding protein n=1 Tax=[Leptolyngbya] sp. PCC 7376 TaxID=111781 RepID=UPI00029ECCA5|nr:ATP-binding protein [[Leptolyngbya] sp. PCC 7376]AFY37914.1 AAA ATPase central domain protein [[Leptolyngbya] sp. PCC 7376]